MELDEKWLTFHLARSKRQLEQIKVAVELVENSLNGLEYMLLRLDLKPQIGYNGSSEDIISRGSPCCADSNCGCDGKRTDGGGTLRGVFE